MILSPIDTALIVLAGFLAVSRIYLVLFPYPDKHSEHIIFRFIDMALVLSLSGIFYVAVKYGALS